MAKTKKSDRTAQEGFALLAAPEDVTGAGVDGVMYEVDEDGLLEVRAEHVPELLAHGCKPVE